jgi:hypothetical protein
LPHVGFGNSLIEMEMFNNWVKDTFVPELIDRRRKWSYDGPAFLILDNCSAKSGDDFAGMCEENRIVPVFLHDTRRTNSGRLTFAFLD